MKVQPHEIWDPVKGGHKRGVTPATLAKWERVNGVKLPQLLRDALRIQNGGRIRYSGVAIKPLQKFTILSKDFWEFAEREGFLRTELCFEFAEDEDHGQPFYLLNFNAKGPQGAPTVHHHYNDGSIYRDARTVEDFFAGLISVDAKPAVDWSETEKLEVVLFRETTTQAMGASRTTVECVVGRRAGKLFLYRHEISNKEEIYFKAQLAEPLDADEAHIQSYPIGPVYGLMLRSKRRDGVVETQSHRMTDGTWKNGDSGGSLDDVQSSNRVRLVKLRRQLLGEKGAAKAEAFDQNMGEWAALGQKVQSMPKGNRKAVRENIAMHFMAKLDDISKGKDVDFDELGKSALELLRNSVGQPDKSRKKKS